MTKEQIEIVVKLDLQIKELKAIQKRNFDDFCIGTYNEYFNFFMTNSSTELLNGIRKKCADYFQKELSDQIIKLEKEMADL